MAVDISWYTLIFSLMARSMRTRPIRNWFSSSSPTARTRRLPRWSMSSTTPMLLRSFSKYLIAATKSGESSVRLSSGVSRPSLMLKFRRPTRLKSYLRASKNMPRNRLVAVSSVGGAGKHHADVVALREEHVDFGDAGFRKGLPKLGGQRLVGLEQHFAGLAV